MAPRKKKERKPDPEDEAFYPPQEDGIPNLSKGEVEEGSETRQDRFAAWSAIVMTDLEKKVWKWLGGKNNPWGFEPQVPVGPYTLDFFSRRYMLAIEADGPEHQKTVCEDAARDAELEKLGILTLRLTNADFVKYSKQRLFDLVEEFIQTKHIVNPQPYKDKK
jgi:very-short-patch-repair endonuclease